ncbi:sensor histidine kinase [Paenibacillus sp. NPDC058071]|uniref:cache domain-containing sensor histidine kinase n=1 Tax=Paenibacillus sp. NPDC058071 TaxID=3346326 RepID=UPI0036D94CD4
MTTLFSHFRNLPLQRKLLISMIPLLLVTVGITGLYSYLIASREVIEKTRQSQQNIAIKTRDQLDYYANNMISFANYSFLNPSIQAMSHSDEPKLRDQALKTLVPLMVTGESIQSLLLYPFPKQGSASPFVITHTGIASAISYEKFQATGYFKRFIASGGKRQWDLLAPSDHVLTGDSHYKIMLIQPYKNVYTYEQTGLIVVGMDADRLSRKLYHDSGDDVQFVTDENGTVLAASELEWIGQPVTQLPLLAASAGAGGELRAVVELAPADGLRLLKANDKLIVSESVSETTGWHTVVVQKRALLLSELNYIRFVTFGIMLIVSIIAILLFWKIARFVTNPMKQLMLSMKALQNGDFTQRVELSGYDEIGLLGHLYNKMVVRIKLLIDDVYASGLKQREAELKALQSQINPHFLYNTLNMIHWSAVRNNDREISDMVVSLSQVFRLSLNSGNHDIELAQEIELVRHYLFLQQKRYTNRLHFEIETNEALKHFQMPKLLLQPLVENAIVHAIELAEHPVNIHLRAYTDKDWIVLEVADNGPGIPKETLAEIRQALAAPAASLRSSSSGGSGMALSNIKERLSLYYEQSAFEIESKEGIGTRVQIRIRQGGARNGA